MIIFKCGLHNEYQVKITKHDTLLNYFLNKLYYIT